MSLEILLPSGMIMDLLVSTEAKIIDIKLFILDQVHFLVQLAPKRLAAQSLYTLIRTGMERFKRKKKKYIT